MGAAEGKHRLDRELSLAAPLLQRGEVGVSCGQSGAQHCLCSEGPIEPSNNADAPFLLGGSNDFVGQEPMPRCELVRLPYETNADPCQRLALGGRKLFHLSLFWAELNQYHPPKSFQRRSID